MKAQSSKQQTKSTPVTPKTNRSEQGSAAGAAVLKTQPAFDDLHARITIRAYYLYVERGRREGSAEQDWLDAEREIVKSTFPV